MVPRFQLRNITQKTWKWSQISWILLCPVVIFLLWFKGIMLHDMHCCNHVGKWIDLGDCFFSFVLGRVPPPLHAWCLEVECIFGESIAVNTKLLIILSSKKLQKFIMSCQICFCLLLKQLEFLRRNVSFFLFYMPMVMLFILGMMVAVIGFIFYLEIY